MKWGSRASLPTDPTYSLNSRNAADHPAADNALAPDRIDSLKNSSRQPTGVC